MARSHRKYAVTLIAGSPRAVAAWNRRWRRRLRRLVREHLAGGGALTEQADLPVVHEVSDPWDGPPDGRVRWCPSDMAELARLLRKKPDRG